MPAGVSLETDRLLLRPFRDADHGAHAAMCADEEVMRCVGTGRDRVISPIRPGNARSIRVAERLGERLAGEVELLGSKALVYEVRA